MTNLALRRFLADAADPVPWQALSRAIERPVTLPPGADATATEPPPLPVYESPARRLSLAIVVPHLMAGGGERTSVLLAKHLHAGGKHHTFDRVAVFNADAHPHREARTFGPYRDDLLAAGVPYTVAMNSLADYDAVLWWGRVVPPVRKGQRTIYFVNAPSEAAAADLRFVKAHVRVDRAVAASVGTARMAERVLEWPEGSVAVVWNGAEAGEVDGLPPSPPEGRGGRFVMGFIGRFAAEKNLLSTVAALRLLPEHVTARFVGAGPEPIERAAKAWGVADRVEVLPPTGDRRAFYGGIDCFVLPSLYEATPTVVAEAMLAGVPVVASAVGDLPCILGGEWRGWPIKHRGPEGIAEAVTDLATEAIPNHGEFVGQSGCRYPEILCMGGIAPREQATYLARAFARQHLTAERMAAGYEAAVAGGGP